MALTQITDEVERLEKTYEGYNGVSLTNFALTTAPEIANGSIIEIGGAIWEASGGNEAIAGWAGIGNGNDVYIYIDAAGAATFSTTAPTWDTAKQGYYNGTDRAVAGLYKVDAATYFEKYIIKDVNSIINHKEYGTGNTDIIGIHTFDVPFIGAAQLYHIQHKTAGDGGTSVNLTWNTRPLATEITTEITGASLAANQITLPLGSYYVEWWSITIAANGSQSRFRNITDGTTDILGMVSPQNSNADDFTIGNGKITIAGTKVFEVHHYTRNGVAVTGLGQDENTGEDNVYADIRIWKLA
jgi:hypothetical protein